MSGPQERPRPQVVCSIAGATVEEIRGRLAALSPACGLVEIRADRLRAEELGDLVARAGRPVLAAARRAADGGAFTGSENERRALLEQALDAGAAWVDVEHGSALAPLAEGDRAARVVLSAHGSSCGAGELLPLYRAMCPSRAGRLKIVPEAREPGQVMAIRELLARAVGDGRALAAFATGRAGVMSRVLAPAWGSWATYGPPAPGLETAEGQLSVPELLDDYDVLAIGRDTTLYALVGTDVRRSPSPAMHMTAYRLLGLDARYLALDLERFEDVLPLLRGSAGATLAGLAVTMPFKQDAARLARPGDEIARAAGVVNTVLVDRGGWSGYNTDGAAAIRLARQRIALHGSRVAVVGAGGTGRALAAAFKQEGAAVRIYNRDPARGRLVAAELGIAAEPLERLADAEWDVLAHCTPLGSRGETVLLPSRLTGRLVLDVVYGPHPTPLVEAARARGLAAIDGFELLVAQAVLQFERMTGRRPDPTAMIRAGRRFMARMQQDPAATLDASGGPE